MKKILTVLAACMTLTTAFVSCGYNDDDDKSSEKKSKSSVSDDADDAKSSSKKDKDSDSSDNDNKNEDDEKSNSKKDKDSDSSDDDEKNEDDEKTSTKKDKNSEIDSDAEKIIKVYADSLYGRNAAEEYYSLILPDEYIDFVKEDDTWNDVIDEYNQDVEEALEGYDIKIKSIEMISSLTDAQLACVEEYFSLELDLEGVTASKGYEYHIEIEGTDLESGETEIDEGEVCIVKLKEGWKVIEETAEDLEYYYGE